MFANRELNVANRKRTVAENNIKGFLGAGTDFEGRVVFSESIRLDGTFRGEIISKDVLLVGDMANLQAEVMVDTLIVSGHFQGNIKARTGVKLRYPAQVTGAIEAPVLSIEDGVVFNGTIKMTGRAEIDESKVAAA